MSKYYEVNGKTYEVPEEATPDQLNAYILGNQKPAQPIQRNSGDPFGTLNEMEREMERTPVDAIRDLLAGGISGLGKAGQYIATKVNPNAPRVDFDKLTESIQSPHRSQLGDFSKAIAGYLPLGIAGGARVLPQMAAGGLYGASQSKPDEQHLFGMLPEGELGGAIAGAGMNALIPGVIKGIDALRPSNLFRGNLTPKQLQKNLATAQGTETSLGHVIESPFLQRQYENILSKLPFSGVEAQQGRTAAHVMERGNNILSEMRGGSNPETITDDLSSFLQSQFKAHQAKKQRLYEIPDKIADEMNLQLSLPKFSATAAKFLDALESTNILKMEPDARFLINKLRNYQNPVKTIESPILEYAGKPFTHSEYPSLKEANLLAGKLNDLAEKYGAIPESQSRGMAEVFGQLGKALKSDIKTEIGKSGNKFLKDSFAQAEDNYAKNFSPFLDKDIYQYATGRQDPDTIVQKFLTQSTTADRSKKLSKLSKQLGDKEQKLLQYSYFSRALEDGELNPNQLSTLIKKISKNPNQFKALVPDKIMRDRLKSFRNLYTMNTKAVNRMFNRETGQMNLDILPLGLMHAGSAITGGSLYGLPGALAGLFAPGLMARPMTKALTSESTRKKLVQKMIENKPLIKDRDIRYLQAALQSGSQVE